MKKCIGIVLLFLQLFVCNYSHAQKKEILFQNFLRNSRIESSNYYFISGERVIRDKGLYSLGNNYLNSKMLIEISKRIELGLSFGLTSNIEGWSVTDLNIAPKYKFNFEKTSVSLGAFITIPSGKKNIFQGNSIYSIFVSMTNEVSKELLIHLMLNGVLSYQKHEIMYDFGEFKLEDNASQIAIGISYFISDKISTVLEISNNDYPLSIIDRTLIDLGLTYAISDNSFVNVLIGKDFKSNGDIFYSFGFCFK